MKSLSAIALWSLAMAPVAVAQVALYSSSAEYVARLNNSATDKARDFHEWLSESGDLNGDGIADLAMIVSFSDDSGGPIRARLVVLAGVAGGGYAVLSESAQYCQAQKFYNMSIQGGSLFVQAVDKAEPDASASDTLQFRFNSKQGDLEAIGRENVWDSASEGTWGRLSENYLTGAVVESEKARGRAVRNKQTKSKPRPLTRLNGFSC